MYNCATCHVNSCKTKGKENPIGCPCNEEDFIEKIKEKYSSEDNFKIANSSAKVEAEGYRIKTRLEEIMDFANKCNYKKLGLAFCIGLIKEAEILVRILKANGFTVESVVCKSSNIGKDFIGIGKDETVHKKDFEAMCNPIGQAMYLNKCNTDLNIILGLCVGHDSLFIKHSKAPITVFGVKDRVLAHNPIAALYMADGYFKNRFFKEDNINK